MGEQEDDRSMGCMSLIIVAIVTYLICIIFYNKESYEKTRNKHRMGIHATQYDAHLICTYINRMQEQGEYDRESACRDPY